MSFIVGSRVLFLFTFPVEFLLPHIAIWYFVGDEQYYFWLHHHEKFLALLPKFTVESHLCHLPETCGMCKEIFHNIAHLHFSAHRIFALVFSFLLPKSTPIFSVVSASIFLNQTVFCYTTRWYILSRCLFTGFYLFIFIVINFHSFHHEDLEWFSQCIIHSSWILLKVVRNSSALVVPGADFTFPRLSLFYAKITYRFHFDVRLKTRFFDFVL